MTRIECGYEAPAWLLATLWWAIFLLLIISIPFLVIFIEQRFWPELLPAGDRISGWVLAAMIGALITAIVTARRALYRPVDLAEDIRRRSGELFKVGKETAARLDGIDVGVTFDSSVADYNPVPIVFRKKRICGQVIQVSVSGLRPGYMRGLGEIRMTVPRGPLRPGLLLCAGQSVDGGDPSLHHWIERANRELGSEPGDWELSTDGAFAILYVACGSWLGTAFRTRFDTARDLVQQLR